MLSMKLGSHPTPGFEFRDHFPGFGVHFRVGFGFPSTPAQPSAPKLQDFLVSVSMFLSMSYCIALISFCYVAQGPAQIF